MSLTVLPCSANIQFIWVKVLYWLNSGGLTVEGFRKKHIKHNDRLKPVEKNVVNMTPPMVIV